DLREQRVLDLRWVGLHLAAAETLQISEPRMGADGDAVRLRRAYGAAHHARVPGVPAARDIGGGDVRHHLGVGPHHPRAERLAHVAIDVDHHPGGFAPRIPPTRSLAGARRPRAARVAHFASARSLRTSI